MEVYSAGCRAHCVNMATDAAVLKIVRAYVLLGEEYMQAEQHGVYSSVRDSAKLRHHELLQLVSIDFSV